MRRRALLAASAASGGGGEQSWAYELHLTPEWESVRMWEEAYIYGDFSSLLDTFISISESFGSGDEYGGVIREFPEEFIFTVDGISISGASYSVYNPNEFGISFGDLISGYILADHIYLEKW